MRQAADSVRAIANSVLASLLLLQRQTLMSHAVQELIAAIQRYCAANPSARDSIEGMTWWLGADLRTARAEDLRSAIEYLLDRGVLERHRLADGTQVFGCAPPARESHRDELQ